MADRPSGCPQRPVRRLRIGVILAVGLLPSLVATPAVAATTTTTSTTLAAPHQVTSTTPSTSRQATSTTLTLPHTTTTVPRSTTTTTLPRATTTTVPRSTTTTTAPRPTTTVPRTTTTVPRTTTTVPRRRARVPKVATSAGDAARLAKVKGKHVLKLSAQSLADELAAARAAEASLGRIDAIDAYRSAQRQAAADATTLAAAVHQLTDAESAAARAAGTRRAAVADSGSVDGQLAQLAVAAYTGAAYSSPLDGPSALTEPGSGAGAAAPSQAGEVQDAAVLVLLVTQRVEADARAARAEVVADTSAERAADRAVTAARTVVSADQRALDRQRGQVTLDAATARAGTPSAPDANTGPAILGPSLLTAGELAGWYASTGVRADTTVPMAKLAADYLAAGKATGVRADIAFAQSVVETGYFSFPAGGQLTGRDNNFAGIGACDSCAHGWSFPTAATGVLAQLQLLEAYASTTPVSTPLIGSVGVGGCCQTWMDLSDHWATNPSYGTEILDVYAQMLQWAIPQRLAAAGLAAGGR